MPSTSSRGFVILAANFDVASVTICNWPQWVKNIEHGEHLEMYKAQSVLCYQAVASSFPQSHNELRMS